MSFHGGIMGVILGLVWFARYKRIPLLQISDEVAVTVPLGIFLGRIANYLNNELVGFAGYSGPFAMIRDGVGHFPSPLLEAILEGLLLGGILLHLQRNKVPIGIISGVFLMEYALCRLFVESYFRLPDPQIGYIFGIFTLGQILSVPVLLLGTVILGRSLNLTK